jgi:hypothetical protein
LLTRSPLMFETVIAAMLKHKQGIFAAIAVTALIGYIAPPAAQFAQAQSLGEDIASDVLDSVFGGGDEAETAATDGGVSGDDNQNIEQTQEQEQEAEQEVDQESDQSETNVQANDLETGDNTATVTQSNDADQTVAAEATAAAESLTEGGCCDDDHHDKHKKHHSSDSGSDSGGTSSETEAEANAAAEGTQDNDNIATVDQDSRIHDVDLSNNVAFGDDENTQVAIPIIDQDQRADQRAANLDLDIDYGFRSVEVDEDEDGLDIDPDVLACLQLPPGQVRQCIEDLEE